MVTGFIWGNGSKMTEDQEILDTIQGEVKWFDPAKGFGFIVADGEAGGSFAR